jgi:hypothetical protein
MLAASSVWHGPAALAVTGEGVDAVGVIKFNRFAGVARNLPWRRHI